LGGRCQLALRLARGARLDAEHLGDLGQGVEPAHVDATHELFALLRAAELLEAEPLELVEHFAGQGRKLDADHEPAILDAERADPDVLGLGAQRGHLAGQSAELRGQLVVRRLAVFLEFLAR